MAVPQPVYLVQSPAQKYQSSNDNYCLRIENNNSYTLELFKSTKTNSSLEDNCTNFQVPVKSFNGSDTITARVINYHLTLNNINQYNNEVRWEDAGLSYSVNLTVGAYSPSSFTTELVFKMNTVGAGTYTGTYNATTDTISISETSGPTPWHFVSCPLLNYEISCVAPNLTILSATNILTNIALINTPIIYVQLGGEISLNSSKSITYPNGISFVTSFKPVVGQKDGYYIVSGSLTIDCMEILKDTSISSMDISLYDWKGRRLSDVYGITVGDFFSIQFAISL